MKIIILALAVLIGFVLPALSEEDSIFWIFPMSDGSVHSHPLPRKTSRGHSRQDLSWSGWEVPTVTLRSSVGNKFLLSNGEEDYGRSVVQTDLYVIFKSGFYVDLWNSMPMKKNVKELGTELDYNVGWIGSLGGKTSMDIGVTYCDTPKLGRMGAADDVFYSYIKLIQSVGKFNFYSMAENNSPMLKSSFGGGSLLSLGVSRSDTYMDNDLTLDMSVEPVYDTGEFSLSSGMFVRGKVGFNWNVEKNLTVIFPQVNYYVPLTVHDSRTPDTAISSGFVYQF